MTGRIVASVVLLTGCACLASHCSSANAQEKGAPAAAAPAPRSSPEVEAWVKEVASKMTDSNEIIRRSAVHALLAVGPDALPSLGKLAASDDAKVAGTAMDVIAAIKHGAMGPGPGGPPPFGGPGHQGGPGFHPGGPEMRGGPDMHGGPGGPRGPMGPMGMHQGPGRMLDELGLDAAARTKVEEVLKAFHERARALHEKAMQSQRDAVHAEIEKLFSEAEEALKPLLTPEQIQKLKDSMGPRGPRPEQVPGQGPGPK